MPGLHPTLTIGSSGRRSVMAQFWVRRLVDAGVITCECPNLLSDWQ